MTAKEVAFIDGSVDGITVSDGSVSIYATAKYLFEKLGYEKELETSTGFTYTSKHDMKSVESYNQISFSITSKSYSAGSVYIFYQGNSIIEPLHITPELHKAINKQVEELGW